MSSAWRFQSTYSLAPPPRSSRTRPATAIQRSSSSAPISLISIIDAERYADSWWRGARRSRLAPVSVDRRRSSVRDVALTVNGTRHELEVEPRDLLVHVLRERLSLTGTNVGCDTSSCGACTVLLDGESVKSCTVLGRPGRRRRDHDDRRACHERRAPSRPAGLPRPSRAAVRLLHAGHGDGGGLADRERRGDRPRRDPARASRGTSAAAPATTTSSRRSPRRPGARHERHRDTASSAPR